MNFKHLFFSLIGKKKDDVENFINEGVYQIEKLKEDGWITNIQYEDEVLNVLILFGLEKIFADAF